MINFAHIKARRRFLAEQITEIKADGWLEETCVPSYCHTNLAAAGTAWWRLFRAAELMRRHAPAGPVLDFGAAAGELRHLLPDDTDYDYVEQGERMSDILKISVPDAQRRELNALPNEYYACVFALDSLEHNENYADILGTLIGSLRKDGVLIISGPTEGFLYKFGRRLAGFGGHYHVTNIHEINAATAEYLQCLRTLTGPALLPLFVLSVWNRRVI